MNYRNKYFGGTVRIFFGLLMAMSGISFFLMADPMAGAPEAIVPVMTALTDSGLIYMIKVTEAVAGLMLVFNFLPALAAIFIAPIAIGIIVFNAMLAPGLVFMGVIVAVFDAYLGYFYWDKYKALFKK